MHPYKAAASCAQHFVPVCMGWALLCLLASILHIVISVSTVLVGPHAARRQDSALPVHENKLAWSMELMAPCHLAQ